MVGHFPCFDLANPTIHLISYETTFNTIIYIPLAPTSNMLVVCYPALQKVQTWIFHILPSSQESMTS
jgi:hypothetical protein